MTIVRSARCCGITTCRTPGVWSAVDTGSPDELLDELLLLPPHALTPTASAHATPIEPGPRNTLPNVIASPPIRLPSSATTYPTVRGVNGWVHHRPFEPSQPTASESTQARAPAGRVTVSERPRFTSSCPRGRSRGTAPGEPGEPAAAIAPGRPTPRATS